MGPFEGGALFPALNGESDQRILQIARGLGIARLQRAETIGERAVFAVLPAGDLGDRGVDGAGGVAVLVVEFAEAGGQRLDL